MFGRSDVFLDLPGGRCRRTLKYFDEIGVFRDFLENQRDDRGRTIRVIRSQWDEKRGSMVVWSIGRFFGPSRRTVPEDFEIRRDFEIFRRDWIFRDFLENQRDDRGRTIRVIRSQWNEKRESMVVWSIGRFFGPSRRTVPEDFEIRRDFEIFRRDWSFSRFSRKPARRPRSNHQSNTFAMGRETWINGCLVDRTIFWTIPEDGAGGL